MNFRRKSPFRYFRIPLNKLFLCLQDKGAVFKLRLDDISGAFMIEPDHGSGSTSITIRVANGSLDYENPNQRKFILLVN